MVRPENEKSVLGNREDILNRMGTHVLENGLNTASLRPLAQAANTSDRILIYHFGSKDALISELLQSLAGRMAAQLEIALPAEPSMSLNACATEIVALLRSPALKPYMGVWLHIVTSATQGSATHRAIGGAIVEGFFDCLQARLPLGTKDPETTARAMLVVIDGTLGLDAVGQTDAADRAIAHLFPI